MNLTTRLNAMCIRLLIPVTLVCLTCVCSDAVAQELDPQQQAWSKPYSKQPNAPNPEEMLLNTDDEPDLSDGFEPLFNGTDLTGWVAKGGTCTFEVKDGLIIGTCVPGSNSTYLCTEKSNYKNFVFTCDLKMEVDGNTGVQFRSKTKPGKTDAATSEIVYGPQVEIEGQGKKGRHWSGGIYGQSCGGHFYPLWLKEHEKARAAEDATGWNRVTISAEGDVVKTWLNGVPCAHWVGDGTYADGFFALQVHKGNAGTILFKNIQVKELAE
ncbi:hypothetical protein FHS27_005327 [Rhodopirellula rubra]|uniref:3-keto-alpha-glucoside-1,2-lyase/3-keto-2-hydroxy-glucal hydratase domain-containing protein n=1 Tax=Aporhodopirellula rubra TaxID=980271 RepID=A0A7W5E437_9BACT|nr:DUF1080 domain-containing protein [Aporhodopirellula rubra]MBB3209487.1 hypothetical protein [Aporhodopirellula rubra]